MVFLRCRAFVFFFLSAPIAPAHSSSTPGRSRSLRRSPGAQSCFKTKPNPSAGNRQPACPLGINHLGDSRPGPAHWLGEWARLGAEGAVGSAGPWAGVGERPPALCAFSRSEPRLLSFAQRWVASGSALSVGRPPRMPLREPGRAASSAWQSSCGNSMF